MFERGVASTDCEPPIRVFLSYANVDDLVLEFIEPFAASLRHMALADQGRTLEVFIDRESVDWGADWQAAIREGIDGAMVFMPIVTRQYFDRQSCRDELLTFSSEAKARGVPGLLLPVVLLGHAYIAADSQDVAARIISERQHRDLKQAWIEGPQSAVWRSTIVRLAGELVSAATAAERALGEAAARPPVRGDAEVDDSPGAAEVGEALELFGDESQRLVHSLTRVLETVPTVTPDPELLQRMPPGELREALQVLAARLQPLGAEFQDVGREFESVTTRTDEIMRAYIRYLRENRLDDMLERERESLVGADEAFAPIGEIEAFLTTFLEMLRPLEVSSAPMRNSVRGFREGGKAVSSGIAIMRHWSQIADEN
jgi:TIR domain